LQIRGQRREIDDMGGTARRVVNDSVEINERVVPGGILIAFLRVLCPVRFGIDGLAAARSFPAWIVAHVFHVSFPGQLLGFELIDQGGHV
jgi:hypothetical protein